MFSSNNRTIQQLDMVLGSKNGMGHIKVSRLQNEYRIQLSNVNGLTSVVAYIEPKEIDELINLFQTIRPKI